MCKCVRVTKFGTRPVTAQRGHFINVGSLSAPNTKVSLFVGIGVLFRRYPQTLKEAGVRISMDGRGRWMDNIFIERVWRTLKYESVYLHELETGTQARQVIGRWVSRYNDERPHSSLDDKIPTVLTCQAPLCKTGSPLNR